MNFKNNHRRIFPKKQQITVLEQATHFYNQIKSPTAVYQLKHRLRSTLGPYPNQINIHYRQKNNWNRTFITRCQKLDTKNCGRRFGKKQQTFVAWIYRINQKEMMIKVLLERSGITNKSPNDHCTSILELWVELTIFIDNSMLNFISGAVTKKCKCHRPASYWCNS